LADVVGDGRAIAPPAQSPERYSQFYKNSSLARVIDTG